MSFSFSKDRVLGTQGLSNIVFNLPLYKYILIRALESTYQDFIHPDGSCCMLVHMANTLLNLSDSSCVWMITGCSRLDSTI